MGSLDALSREFAREHSERLWKQLVIADGDAGELEAPAATETLVAFGLAVAAARRHQGPGAVRHSHQHGATCRLSTSATPASSCCRCWSSTSPGSGGWRRGRRWPRGAVRDRRGLFANVYPFATRRRAPQVLSALHLPIALWLVVGVAYAGGHWLAATSRMNFVRFSGELFIYYVLIALGGGVLTASR